MPSFVYSAEDMESLEVKDLDEETPVNIADLDKEDEDPPVGAATEDVGGDGDPAPAAPKVYAADHPIEDWRGKTEQEVADMYQHMRHTAATAITAIREQAAAIGDVARSRQPAKEEDDTPDYQLTSEDLLGTEPGKVNTKLDAMFAAKATPLMRDVYQKQSVYNLKLCKLRKDEMPLFDKYEAEIVKEATKYAVTQTADINTWDAIYESVVRRHPEDTFEIEAKKRGYIPSTGSKTPPAAERGKGGSSAGAKRTGKKTGASLSPEKKAMADRLGVSYDDYAAYDN
jgi:hypothetical protein